MEFKAFIADVWQIPTREINKMLSTEMYVLKRSARKSRMERMKNEHRIKEIMGVKGKPDIIDIIEQKRLQWYGHVKRMPEERIPKLIMDWIPWERRKRGRPRKTWVEGVQADMTTRNLEPDQWRNREQWRLVPGRRRQLLKNRTDRQIDRSLVYPVQIPAMIFNFVHNLNFYIIYVIKTNTLHTHVHNTTFHIFP